MVQPLPTQRGSTSGPPSTTGPGAAWALCWMSRPNPSEYTRVCTTRVCAPAGRSAGWVSRASAAATTGCGCAVAWRCGGRRPGRRRCGWWRRRAEPAGCRWVGRGRLAIVAVVEVGGEPVEGVALRVGLDLAHDGGADDQAERVVGDRGLVAVGVGDQPRGEDPVVLAGWPGAVADGCPRTVVDQQVVAVVGDGGGLAERVGEPSAGGRSARRRRRAPGRGCRRPWGSRRRARWGSTIRRPCSSPGTAGRRGGSRPRRSGSRWGRRAGGSRSGRCGCAGRRGRAGRS